MEKVCSKCKTSKPGSEYYAVRNTRDKRYSSCKDCCRKAQREFYRENPEKEQIRRDKSKEKTRLKSNKWYNEHKEYRKQYHIEKTKERKALLGEEYYRQRRERSRGQRGRIRKLFFDMYGRVCACCNESNMGFLTMEHINGVEVKNKNRPTADVEYRKAIKQYRPDIYTVLCYNCNCGKSRNGGICPHKIESFQ